MELTYRTLRHQINLFKEANMRVLIVEDNEAKKDNIIRLLEKEEITDYKTEKFVTKVFQKLKFMMNKLNI